MKDDRLYLVHMSECIARIVQYTAAGKGAFFADTMVQDAVVRNLQTLAESSARLSAGLKARRPEVPWRSIAAFRNVVVHEYLGLDVVQIWEIVERDIPALKEQVEGLLASA